MESSSAVLRPPLTRDESGTLLGQTMGLVASTAALFALGGFGAFGYATRRDLSAIARFCFWALIAPIVFGAVIRSLPPEGARHE